MNSDMRRIPSAGAVPPYLLVAGAVLLGLLVYGLSVGNRGRVNIAADRLILAECWSAIDRVGLQHGGRETLLEGCRRMERGFRRTYGSRP